MSNDAKRLYKVNEGKMICGVCQGLAEYFNLDPSLVRIASVILACACGSGILVYLAAAVILPEKNTIQ